MRTSIKIIAAAFSMVAILGNAHAEDQSANPANRALHRAIAMQGDQALLDIQASAAGSIPQSIREQMALSLPVYSVAVDSPQIQPQAGATQVAVMTLDY